MPGQRPPGFLKRFDGLDTHGYLCRLLSLFALEIGKGIFQLPLRQWEPLIGLLRAPASYSIGVGFPPGWYGLLLGLGLRLTRHPIPARSTPCPFHLCLVLVLRFFLREDGLLAQYPWQPIIIIMECPPVTLPHPPSFGLVGGYESASAALGFNPYIP